MTRSLNIITLADCDLMFEFLFELGLNDYFIERSRNKEIVESTEHKTI